MPSLSAARGQSKKGANAQVDFGAVWEITNDENVIHEGVGYYSYIGKGSDVEEDIGQMRTLRPLSPYPGLSSFEVTIVNTGEKNFIAIGVCNKLYPHHLLPGWEETSIALHTEDGSIFNSSDDAEPLGMPCNAGAIIKCMVLSDPLNSGSCVVEFFKDGERVKSVPTVLPQGGFYGVVGMMTSGEKIKMAAPMVTRSVEFDKLWQVCTHHTVKHHGGGVCTYVGPGEHDESSVGTVRTKNPIILSGERTNHSFEIRIVDPGEKVYIAIGVCSSTYPHNLLPGWKEISLGYHADNGGLFFSSEDETPTNHPCQRGDTMRCTLHTIDGSPKETQVTFHRNNQKVGECSMWTPEQGWFECFGMMSRRECVQVLLPEIPESYIPPKLNFFDVWDIATPHLQDRGNGVFGYQGPGGHDAIGTLRSKFPLDPHSKRNSFQVKIIDPGEHCYIALGVCSQHFPTNLLPGWNDISVGFHADNSHIFHSAEGEHGTGCACNRGDVLQCSIEAMEGTIKQTRVIFHHNNNVIGKALVWIPKNKIFAQIGCMSRGEVIQVASPQIDPSILKPDVTPTRSISYPTGMHDTRHSVTQMHPARRGASVGETIDEHIHRTASYTAPARTLSSHPNPVRVLPPIHSITPQPAPTLHSKSHHVFPTPQPIPSLPSQPHHPSLTPHSSPFPTPHSSPSPTPQLHHVSHTHQYLHTASHPDIQEHHAFTQQQASSIPLTPVTGPLQQHSRRINPSFHHEPAQSASPLVLPHQSTGTHPLASLSPSQSAAEAQRSSYYASQVSMASAASESDPYYTSQVSTESQPESWKPAEPQQWSRRTKEQGIDKITRIEDRSASGPPNKPHSLQFVSPSLEMNPDLTPTNDLLETGGSSNVAASLFQHSLGDFPDNYQAGEKYAPMSNLTTQLHEEQKQEEKTPLDDLSTPITVPFNPLVSKDESKLCRMLHNVICTDNTSLTSTVCTESLESSFAMLRLQLTEKIPYFEAVFEVYEPTQDVLVGVVTRDHSHTTPPGEIPLSAAYHSASGSVLVSGQTHPSSITPCKEGDTIGCRLGWRYKLETSSDHQDTVDIEWFRNGCSIARHSLPPAAGYYPAIAMTAPNVKVKVKYAMGMKPEAYFDRHPLPDGFSNFTLTPLSGGPWRCLQNVEVDAESFVIFVNSKPSKPAVVQSSAAFTTVQPYFEVELKHRISFYSTFSLGALERVSNQSSMIPGEGSNSVGLLPLLGFVMRNGGISSTLPNVVTTEMSTCKDRLRLGVGIEFHPKMPRHTVSTKRVRVFFTVNGQQISSVFTSLPEDGFYPTVAIDSHFQKERERLISVHFTDHQPKAPFLPLGFVRAPPNSFSLVSTATVMDKCPPENKESLRAMQAALPLSPSHTYFELIVYNYSKTAVITCGLTSFDHNLFSGPGEKQGSIGFHLKNGMLLQNGRGRKITPSCCYRGARVGCGARFPPDGAGNYAEVFFTHNRKMIARTLMPVPQLGFFPCVAMNTGGVGVVTIDINTPDPFPDMKFSTTWSELKNVKADGGVLQFLSHSAASVAMQPQPVSLTAPTYFTLTALSELNGRVCIGFSTSASCHLPLQRRRLSSDENYLAQSTLKLSPDKIQNKEQWSGCMVDVVSGKVYIHTEESQSVDTFALSKPYYFGCGFEPSKNRTSLLFFVTLDDQVIYCKDFEPHGSTIYPIVHASGSNSRVFIDACAMWPPQTPIGKGWARFENVALVNSKITHPITSKHSKIPVGFVQAAMPLVPQSSYVEIEVCSRSNDKAIAMGLASRTYPSNTWVGWKSNSIAYHLDDGNLFTGSGSYTHKIGPKIFKGHRLGCGIIANSIDSNTATKEGNKVEVFFTVNGALIVGQKVPVPPGGLFPTICLESPSESVILNRFSEFPPVENYVGPEWANAYSIQQAGQILEHSCQHEEMSKGVPGAFCQARQPFSPEKPYFEVKIMSFSDMSKLQAGVSLQIPRGCRSINASNALMYWCARRRGSQAGIIKDSGGTGRCGVGDILGCAVVFTNEQPTSIEFFMNSMKVYKKPVPENMQNEPLYPTITISQSRDAVLPSLGLPYPTWDQSMLIGWLRSERVQLRSSVVEYLASGKGTPGVCQISQCIQSSSTYSFEVEVLDVGEKGTIGVGLAPADHPLNNHPGWASGSIGYHGDDGCLFHEDGRGWSFGPAWKRMDIIGLGVRSIISPLDKEEPELQVYFCKNGVEVGHTTVTVPPTGLYPTVGFHSQGEKIRITPTSCKLGNFASTVLLWRTLCGVRVSQPQPDLHLLEYISNGRILPQTGVRLGLAVFAQSFSEDMQYFEVELSSLGPQNAIAIGVTPKRYPFDHATGWVNGSVGYHTDNGQLYHSRGKGKQFGPTAKIGDTIGCGVNLIPNNTKQCSIFFTYNGVEIGRVRVAIPTGGLFPSLSLTHELDKVKVRIAETFKPKFSYADLRMVGLMRISNCSYSDQIVSFTGGANANNPDPGIAQFAVSMHRERNYFAANILKNLDGIVIGLAVKDYPLKYLPGFTSVSMAYDTAKGTTRVVCDSANFNTYQAPVCKQGDTVGCGLVMSESKKEPGFVFFTRNNEVFQKINCPDIYEDLFPIIGFVPNLRASVLFLDWNVPVFDFPNPLSDC